MARRPPGKTEMGGRQKDREKDGREKGGRRENVGANEFERERIACRVARRSGARFPAAAPARGREA